MTLLDVLCQVKLRGDMKIPQKFANIYILKYDVQEKNDYLDFY